MYYRGSKNLSGLRAQHTQQARIGHQPQPPPAPQLTPQLQQQCNTSSQMRPRTNPHYCLRSYVQKVVWETRTFRSNVAYKPFWDSCIATKKRQERFLRRLRRASTSTSTKALGACGKDPYSAIRMHTLPRQFGLLRVGNAVFVIYVQRILPLKSQRGQPRCLFSTTGICGDLMLWESLACAPIPYLPFQRP